MRVSVRNVWSPTSRCGVGGALGGNMCWERASFQQHERPQVFSGQSPMRNPLKPTTPWIQRRRFQPGLAQGWPLGGWTLLEVMRGKGTFSVQTLRKMCICLHKSTSFSAETACVYCRSSLLQCIEPMFRQSMWDGWTSIFFTRLVFILLLNYSHFEAACACAYHCCETKPLACCF